MGQSIDRTKGKMARINTAALLLLCCLKASNAQETCNGQPDPDVCGTSITSENCDSSVAAIRKAALSTCPVLCDSCTTNGNPKIRASRGDLLLQMPLGGSVVVQLDDGEDIMVNELPNDIRKSTEMILSSLVPRIDSLNETLISVGADLSQFKEDTTTTLDEHTMSLKHADENISALADRLAALEDAFEAEKQATTAARKDLATETGKVQTNLDKLEKDVSDSLDAKTDTSDFKVLETRVLDLERDTRHMGRNLVKAADLIDTKTVGGWDTPVKDEDLETQIFIDGLPIKVFRSKEGAKSSDCYIWARTNMFEVDPSKTYEFSLWIKSMLASTDVSTYFGYYLYDKDKKRITEAPHSNPYFKTDKSDREHWNKVYGFLLSTETNNDLYKKKITYDRQFYPMHKNAAYAMLRFGTCYGDNNADDEVYFTLPSARETFVDRDIVMASLGHLFDGHNDQNPNLVTHSNFLNTDQGSTLDKWLDHPGTLELQLFDAVSGPPVPIVSFVSKESGSGCYDWSISNYVPINPNKRYEFSLWIKSTDFTMNNYFGYYIYDGGRNRIGYSIYSNPYFKCSESDEEEWVKYTGHLMPVGNSADNSQCHEGSRYAPARYVLPSHARFAVIRFGSCYANSAKSGQTYYAFPSIREMNY